MKINIAKGSIGRSYARWSGSGLAWQNLITSFFDLPLAEKSDPPLAAEGMQCLRLILMQL